MLYGGHSPLPLECDNPIEIAFSMAGSTQFLTGVDMLCFLASHSATARGGTIGRGHRHCYCLLAENIAANFLFLGLLFFFQRAARAVRSMRGGAEMAASRAPQCALCFHRRPDWFRIRWQPFHLPCLISRVGWGGNRGGVLTGFPNTGRYTCFQPLLRVLRHTLLQIISGGSEKTDRQGDWSQQARSGG